AFVGTPTVGVGERGVGEQGVGEQDAGGQEVGDAVSDRAAGAVKPSTALSGAAPGTDLSPLTEEEDGGVLPDPTQAAEEGKKL
ncbi:MAG: hypothetical protein ACUVTW_13585, partial [Thermogutta sp.]